MLAKPFSSRQKGSILIMVLWLIMLGLILVTAMAANIRLSATTVINHQSGLQQWGALLETIDKAYLEIMIHKMDQIKAKETAKYKDRTNDNPFDGRSLQLHYKTPEGMTVRIYDLSGKINIAKLSEKKLTQLLEHQIGEHNKQIPELVDAWLDWIDKDELKRLNGAEKQYYMKQDLAYEPRNKKFVSVDEILLIKGFEQIFNEINLENVFTLSGSSNGVVNPNVASRQALLMIPGIDETAADSIIQARQAQEFKKINELDIHIPPSAIAKAKNWFSLRASTLYAIVIYPSEFENSNSNKQTITAYMEEVNIRSYQTLPQVSRVLPSVEIEINSL